MTVASLPQIHKFNVSYIALKDNKVVEDLKYRTWKTDHCFMKANTYKSDIKVNLYMTKWKGKIQVKLFNFSFLSEIKPQSK